MVKSEKESLPAEITIPLLKTTNRKAISRFVREFSGTEIKKALVPGQELICPLKELIAIGEAAFTFVYNSEMDISTKNAFHQLEKQFEFYKNLLLAQRL